MKCKNEQENPVIVARYFDMGISQGSLEENRECYFSNMGTEDVCAEPPMAYRWLSSDPMYIVPSGPIAGDDSMAPFV